jgi:hypothetical protein
MHVAILGPLPAANVQVAEGLKLPVLFVVNTTVPVGLVGLVEVSITRAVQLVETLTVTEPGEQVMLVCVGWAVVVTGVEARLNEPELAE